MDVVRLPIAHCCIVALLHCLCLIPLASHAEVYSNGLLVSYQEVAVSARASGVVKEMFVREGQWIAAGDTLAELDAAKEYLDIQLSELELEELHIALKKTKNGPRPMEIEKMEVDLKKASLASAKSKSELDRMKRLVEQKAVSDKDVEDAQNACDASDLSVQSARLTLELAKAGPLEEDVLLQEMKIAQKMTSQDQKKLALEKMTVVSPVDGVISKLYYAAGENAASGQPFCDVLSTDSLYVELNLPISEIKQVKMGSKVSVSVPSVAAASYAGRVVFISPTVDPASRTFKIRIEIANPKRLLKPGLFAAVSF